MKTIKLKSIFALILFSILTLGLASIATSAGTNISNNGFEDSFPKTAGGYVVWQGKEGNDWEIFLYNANDGSGPVQITDNNYGDVNPETDGRYVTWASGFSPNGEIFLYDIATPTTTRITDYQYTDHVNTSCTASADPYPCCTGGICVGETPENCDGSCDSRTECVDTYGGSWTGTGTCNSQYDHDPKIVDGVVVWVSHSEGVDTMYGPGDIMLYNAAYGSYENISRQIDPNNDHDDYAFRFDGNRIQWVQNTSGDMPNYVYDPITDSWGPELNSYIRNYVYDLTTNKYYRYYIPDDGDLDFDAEYYVEDLTAGTAYIQTDSPAVLVDQQSDGDFSVNAMWINGDREILLMDRQNKHGGFLTNNNIKDIQPAIKDNIVVWTGGEGNNSEIYLYTPLCPSDPNKVAPGICGCGVSDTDSDGDGTADCNDQCPYDANNDIDGDGVCGDQDDSADNDFNGDGTSDVLARHKSAGLWYTYLMNYDGVTVKQGALLPFTKDTNWQMQGIADFNADGTSDVLIRHTNGTWWVYLMNVDGTSVKQGTYMPFTKDTNWQLMGIADFNGDGTSDVLVRHKSTGLWYTYLMDYDGVTVKQGALLPFTKDTNWQMQGIADFNGDGTSDVLVRHKSAGLWYTYLMNYDGFTVKQGALLPFTKDNNWQTEGIGDFNADGTSDVLIRHTNGTWWVYLMNVDGTSVKQGTYMPFTKDTNWQLMGTGDRNGDGTSDVLLRHTNGIWYAYLMNTDGVTVKQSGYMPFTKDTNWQ